MISLTTVKDLESNVNKAPDFDIPRSKNGFCVNEAGRLNPFIFGFTSYPEPN